MPVFGTEVDDEGDPSIVGEYCLEERLGDGSYGTVYLASHARTHTNFAIKRIDVYNHNISEISKKVRHEAMIMQEINHSHVVRLMKVMSSKTAFYFVMELAEEGELFNKVLKSKKFPESQARKYFQQLISAIHYCHSKNVIHRDLKAENLLLGKGGVLKVCDFGFSLHNLDIPGCDSGEENAYDPPMGHTPKGTTPGNVDDCLSDSCLEKSGNATNHRYCQLYDEIGTVGYMPPEMFKGSYSACPAEGVQVADPGMHDLWAAGCILYFMLTGRLPFNGRGEQETVHNITNHIVSFDEVPVKARQFVHTLLAHDEKDRYSLDEIIRHEWFRVDLDESLFPSSSKLYGDKCTSRSFLNFSMNLGTNSSVSSLQHIDISGGNGEISENLLHSRCSSAIFHPHDNTSPTSNSSQQSASTCNLGSTSRSGATGSPTGSVQQKANPNGTSSHHAIHRNYHGTLQGVSSPTLSDAGARSHIVPTEEEISLMRKAFQAIDVDNHGTHLTPVQIRDMLYHLKGKHYTTQNDILFLLLFFGVVQSNDNCTIPNAEPSTVQSAGNTNMPGTGKESSKKISTISVSRSPEVCDAVNDCFFFSCASGSTPHTTCSTPYPMSPSCPSPLYPHGSLNGTFSGSKHNVLGGIDQNGAASSHRDALIQKLKRPCNSKQTSAITFEQFVSAWIEKDLGHMGGDELSDFQIKPLAAMKYGTNQEKNFDIVNRTKDWKDVIGQVRDAFDRLDIYHTGLIPIEGFVQLFKEEGMLSQEEEAVATAALSDRSHYNPSPVISRDSRHHNTTSTSVHTRDNKMMITFAEIVQLMKYLDSSSDIFTSSRSLRVLSKVPSFAVKTPITPAITAIKAFPSKIFNRNSTDIAIQSPLKRSCLLPKQTLPRCDSNPRNIKVSPFSLTQSTHGILQPSSFSLNRDSPMPNLKSSPDTERVVVVHDPVSDTPSCQVLAQQHCSQGPSGQLNQSNAFPQCTFYEFLDAIVYRDMLVTHPLGARLAKAARLDSLASVNRREQLCGSNGFTVHGTMKEVCRKISDYSPKRLVLISKPEIFNEKLNKVTVAFAFLKNDSDNEIDGGEGANNDGKQSSRNSFVSVKQAGGCKSSDTNSIPSHYDTSVKSSNCNRRRKSIVHVTNGVSTTVSTSPNLSRVRQTGRRVRCDGVYRSPRGLRPDGGDNMNIIACELDITFCQRSHSGYTAVSMRRISGNTTCFHEAVDLVTLSLKEAIDQAVVDTSTKGDSEFM